MSLNSICAVAYPEPTTAANCFSACPGLNGASSPGLAATERRWFVRQRHPCGAGWEMSSAIRSGVRKTKSKTRCSQLSR